MTNELESLPIDSIQLSVEQMERANQLAQSVNEHRWEVYLHQLAKLGVQQWLSDRAPDLEIHEFANKLTVSSFTLNIITQEY